MILPTLPRTPGARRPRPLPHGGLNPPVATPPVVLRGQRQFPMHTVASGDRPHPVSTVTTWSTTTRMCKGPPPDCRRIVIRLRYGVKGGCDRRATSTGENALVNVHAKPPLTPSLRRIDRQQSVRRGKGGAQGPQPELDGARCPTSLSSGVSHGHQRTAGIRPDLRLSSSRQQRSRSS